MSKTRSQKEMLLESYKQMLTEYNGFIAVDTKSIDNVSVTQLKKQLKALGSKMAVVKNTLFKIALEETGKPVASKDFDGQVAIITYSDDPTAVAKLLKEIQKKSEKLGARYGLIEGDFLSGEKVMQLAEIPSREQLLAKLLGSLNAPLSGFMNVVTGNARGFVQVVKQLSEKGGAAKEAA
ncbi:MAG: 50S ribosomal protein L10 [Candidatus Dojkabacteria bacterium]